eukprot:TRINITY_DN15687_c0_g3_i1.p1 TRINITY_DN15687_c0_g3~~TRINITY_DN15687_c0_g3_i1.p1  ORF type:complete len:190 (+),score=22.97 TRINITY_DN15687_c0_g3_i1:86-655(+)
MNANAVFGVFFVGHSYPITNQHFVQVDLTHWVLDVASTVSQDLEKLKEISLFLIQPNSLDQQYGLGLYVRGKQQDWQYRGFVSTQHPSEVMPLQWSRLELESVNQHEAQIGISVEPIAELSQKQGSKLGARQEFAKKVAMDLFRFMESFARGYQGDAMIVPTNILDQWFIKFEQKFRRDPDFLQRSNNS